MTVPAQAYPEQSQATTILVLGILSLVLAPCFCGFIGIFAWVMGKNELKAIDEGRRLPENRGTANAGMICGIIGTVIWGLLLVGSFWWVPLVIGGAAFNL